MSEWERPYVQIPVALPNWEEHIRKMKENEPQTEEKLDDDRRVIIIDI